MMQNLEIEVYRGMCSKHWIEPLKRNYNRKKKLLGDLKMCHKVQ